MRDLTKSMLRFSWAFSVLGARQMTRMVSPSADLRASRTSLDALSHAAEEQLEGMAESIYRAGKELQEGMVDAVGSLAGGGWTNPAENLSRAMKDTWEAMDRSWSRLRSDAEERGG